MTRPRGFTLLEVLLALAIVSAVLLTAHMVLLSTLSASDRLRAVGEPVASAHSLQWLLREDLRGVPAAELAEESFYGAPAQERARGADLLTFVTVSDPRQYRGGSGLWQVAYKVRPNAEDGRRLDLFRSQVPWRREPLEEKAYEPVFRGLGSFEVEFFTGVEWTQTWPAGSGVPTAVRIRLEPPTAQDREPQTYELVVWIPAGGVPSGGGDAQ